MTISRQTYVKPRMVLIVTFATLSTWNLKQYNKYNKFFNNFPDFSLKALKFIIMARWRHQMETFHVLLALCEGNHRPPVDSPYKGQWRGVILFFIGDWTNG